MSGRARIYQTVFYNLPPAPSLWPFFGESGQGSANDPREGIARGRRSLAVWGQACHPAVAALHIIGKRPASASCRAGLFCVLGAGSAGVGQLSRNP